MSHLPDTALFPLTLVAFEQYMLTDDRPDYPANFFLRLSFTGIFDRPAFHDAVDTALQRHPLLRACVRPSGEKRFEWVLAEHPEPLIDWKADAGLYVSAAGPGIDLRCRTGLQIFLRQEGNRTEMLLQFHHACCDGFAAVQFMEDLLVAYHNAIAGDSQTISLPPPDTARLRVRGKFGMNLAGYLLRAHKELLGALGLIEYFVLRPVPLTPRGGGSPSRPDAADLPASVAHTFTVSESEKLRRATRRIGCTVNDLLLRDLFLTLDDWMSENDPANRTGCFRIVIPVNLRTPADAAMPAANVVGMVINDRKPYRFSSPRRLMKLLRMEMKICKRWRLGLSMIHMLRLARNFRGGLDKILPVNRCLATAVLSNLGELAGETALPCHDGRIAAANVTLDRVEVLPPVRPMTHASFGAVSYAGRLTISLTYAPQRFTRQEGRQLLDGYLRRIQNSISDAD